MGSHVSAGEASAAAVMVALRRIVRSLRLADRAAEEAVGLSAAQLFVLRVLDGAPARSLAEVAERTLTDQSSVSTVVAKLAARRLVARRASAYDARRVELSLTAAGQRVLRDAPRSPQAMISDAVRALPARRRAEIVRSLDALVAALGASTLPPRMLFEDEPKRGRSDVRR